MRENHQKFVFSGTDKEKTAHWETCEKYKIPFILVSSKGNNRVEVFYDITNAVGTDKLELISEKLKALYINYIDFLGIDIPSIQKYLDQYYFFGFELEKEHYQVVVEKLYDFLLREMNN